MTEFKNVENFKSILEGSYLDDPDTPKTGKSPLTDLTSAIKKFKDDMAIASDQTLNNLVDLSDTLNKALLLWNDQSEKITQEMADLVDKRNKIDLDFEQAVKRALNSIKGV